MCQDKDIYVIIALKQTIKEFSLSILQLKIQLQNLNKYKQGWAVRVHANGHPAGNGLAAKSPLNNPRVREGIGSE